MATAKKLPSGNYRVQIYTGQQNGKRQYKSFTAATKREAEFAAAQYLNEVERLSEPAQMTVKEAITGYIDSKTRILSPTTINLYNRIKALYLQDIMSMPLGKLRQEDVQKAVNKDAATTSPKTVRNAHGLLSSALKEYHPDFVLRTKLPQKEKNEMTIPDNEQVKKLLALAKGTFMEPAITLAAFAGLRRSEIGALTKADINPTAGEVKVNKALVKNQYKEWVLKTTKTYTSTRTVNIAPDILKAIVSTLPEDGSILGDHTPDSITHRFGVLSKGIGLNCRFHDLRHYYASVMLALGVPDKYAMELMGHSTNNMLKGVYQHVMKDKKKEVTDKISDYFQSMQHEISHDNADIQ